MAMTYSVALVWSDEDQGYVATSPEFPGLSGVAPVLTKAVAELAEAIEMAIEVLQEEGRTAPEPRRLAEHSGQVRLRLPKSLHTLAVRQAEQDGVSLNALLQSLVAMGLGQARGESQMSEELRRELRASQSYRLAAPKVVAGTGANRAVSLDSVGASRAAGATTQMVN